MRRLSSIRSFIPPPPMLAILLSGWAFFLLFGLLSLALSHAAPPPALPPSSSPSTTKFRTSPLPSRSASSDAAASSTTKTPSPVAPILLPQEGRWIGASLEYVMDPTRKWTLNDLRSPEISARFRRHTQDILSLSYSPHVLWIRFRVQNPTSSLHPWYLEIQHRLTFLQLYSVAQNGHIQTFARTGFGLPCSKRPMLLRNIVYPLSLPAHTTRTYYLRVHTRTSLTVPLRIWTSQTFQRHSALEYLVLGFLYSILLLIALASLWFYLVQHRRIYLLFALLIASLSMGLLGVDGISFWLFWPEHPYWAERSMAFFFHLAIICGCFFLRAYLEPPKDSPILDRILLLSAMISGYGVISSFALAYHWSARILPVALIGPIAALLWHGLRASPSDASKRYPMLSGLFLLIAMGLVYLARAFGYMPTYPWMLWSLQFGAIAMTVLLALGLGLRAYSLRRELLGKEEAIQASKAKSRFLANTSHELRTPLTLILGYTELLLELAQEEEQSIFTESLQEIYSSGQHLLKLINDILDLSKIEAGKQSLELKTFSTEALLQSIHKQFESLAQQNQNDLQLSYPENLGPLYTDETKLKQILFNLLSNACKFTQRGNILLEVWLQKHQNQPSIYFAVSDTGIGIPASQLDAMFLPFMQGNVVHSDGTGLGLAICYQFARILGGELKAQSQSGQGSTFTLRLPYYAGLGSPTPSPTL